MLDASFLLLSILGRNITLQMWHVKKKKKKRRLWLFIILDLPSSARKVLDGRQMIKLLSQLSSISGAFRTDICNKHMAAIKATSAFTN